MFVSTGDIPLDLRIQVVNERMKKIFSHESMNENAAVVTLISHSVDF